MVLHYNAKNSHLQKKFQPVKNIWLLLFYFTENEIKSHKPLKMGLSESEQRVVLVRFFYLVMVRFKMDLRNNFDWIRAFRAFPFWQKYKKFPRTQHAYITFHCCPHIADHHDIIHAQHTHINVVVTRFYENYDLHTLI